ncbi:hypothetical protein NSMS1_38340 [Nostoc sp. MS1]|nr:hypothetical protein NSMS1_38340 [Nostoc sp. MS1]
MRQGNNKFSPTPSSLIFYVQIKVRDLSKLNGGEFLLRTVTKIRFYVNPEIVCAT